MNKFVLYGAAAIGGLAKKAIESKGGTVIGYLDKRAYELAEYNGLPVYSVEGAPAEFLSETVMVFVAVKNVYDHSKIAKLLHESGFQGVIYKPYNVLLGVGTDGENQLASLYDEIYEGNRPIRDLELSKDIMGEKSQRIDYALISENTDGVVAYIPTEFIFTNNYIEGGMAKWGNIPIAALFTHINFFRSLGGDREASVNDYVEEYCVYTAQLQKSIQITDAWKANVIENRTQIYEQMQDAVDLDSQYFVRNAATAEWNGERNFFNLTSGKHRCSFLAAKSAKYIPLRIRRADYDMFLNSGAVESLSEALERCDEGCIVPNPYFYRGIHTKDGGEHNFLLWFSRCFGELTYQKYGKVDFKKLAVYDLSGDFGHFARYLKRAGACVWRGVPAETLELRLNILFNSNVVYCKEMPEETDILIADRDSLERIESFSSIEVKVLILKLVDEETAAYFANNLGYVIREIFDTRSIGLKEFNSYLFVKSNINK